MELSTVSMQVFWPTRVVVIPFSEEASMVGTWEFVVVKKLKVTR